MSLLKRFKIKLVSNLVTLLLNILTLGLVPRYLGAESYGTFNYLTNIFTRVSIFTQFGFLTTYFTKLSREKITNLLTAFYVIFMMLQSVLIFSFLFISYLLFPNKLLFESIDFSISFLVLFFICVQFCTSFFHKTSDALNLTQKYEKLYILHTIIHYTILFIICLNNILQLKNYIIFNILSSSFLLLISVLFFYKNNYKIFKNIGLGVRYFKRIFIIFSSFSYPIFINSILVLVFTILDRWMIQYYYGSSEQGFFSLAFNIAMVLTLVSSSVSQIFAKDTALSQANGTSITILRSYFIKYSPFFLFITSFISIFIGFNSSEIITLIASEKFLKASTFLNILIFYSIQQSIASICIAIILANGNNKIIQKVGFLNGFLSIIMAFFLFSPFFYNLGGLGLSIKLVIAQFICVHCYIYYISNLLKFKFTSFLYFEFRLILLLITIIYFINLIIDNKSFYIIFLKLFIYGSATSIIFYFYPKIFLFKSKNIVFLRNLLQSKLLNLKHE